MAKGVKTGGRRKGSQNKFTGQLKDMILQALNESGGITYLKQTAIDQPVAFLSLVGKVLPLQLTGDPENPVAHKVTHTMDTDAIDLLLKVRG